MWLGELWRLSSMSAAPTFFCGFDAGMLQSLPQQALIKKVNRLLCFVSPASYKYFVTLASIAVA